MIGINRKNSTLCTKFSIHVPLRKEAVVIAGTKYGVIHINIEIKRFAHRFR